MSRRRGVFLAHCKRLATVVDPPAGQALWSELYGPAPTDVMLVIDQPVLLDIDALVHGLEIEGAGELIFDPDSSRLLQVDQQRPVCVMEGGHFEMVPASATIVHELRFIDVDESLYTLGGGMNHEANPGLCVENGTVTLRGATKTGWTRTTGALSVGATSCTVVSATGWRIGDEIVITPTEPTSVTGHWVHFDRRTITNIVGNTINFAATTYPHPSNTTPTGVTIYPEVLNLTRNVKICGQDATHRAQIMLMENCTGSIFEYFEGKFLGPRKMQTGSPLPQRILGRYALHFHLMAEGARDINVTGVALHDLGSRGFVPHGSHGMTFYDCVVWSYFGDGYWWDTSEPIGAPRLPEDESNDLLYDKCFAGFARYVDVNPGGVGMTGFFLGAGVNMTLRNCCVAGLNGATNTGGYTWPASLNHHPTNIWTFENNDAHNNYESGIFIWQNDVNVHEVGPFRAWNNGKWGIDAGAYANRYHYNNLIMWGNGIADFAQLANGQSPSPVRRIEIHGTAINHVRISHHNIPGDITNPNLFQDAEIQIVTIHEPADGGYSFNDFVNCGLHPDDVTISVMHLTSRVRIQTGASAWSITTPDTTTKVVTPIALFA